jgi:formiminotetrahydrofolate cyclodeaminase
MQSYVNALADASPTPGGGSAAAVAGSMAAALVVMVCQVTLGKERYRAATEELLAVRSEADRLKDRLMALAVQDEDAYKKVVGAYRLPKESEAEKKVRHQAIQSALRQATEVPLAVALACADVLKLAGRIVNRINPNALSDLGTAAALADAGLQGARLNVLTNAGGLDDTEFSQSAISQVGLLTDAAVELKDTVHAYCIERFV